MTEIPSETLESILAFVCLEWQNPAYPSSPRYFQPKHEKDAKTTLGSCRLVSRQFLPVANSFYRQCVTLVLYSDTDAAIDSNTYLGRLEELLASPLSTIGPLLQSVWLSRQTWNTWYESEDDEPKDDSKLDDTVATLLSHIDRLPNVKQLYIGRVQWTATSTERWSPCVQNCKTTVTSLSWASTFSSATGLIDATAAVASSKLDRFELHGVDFTDRWTIPSTGGKHGSQILSQTTYFSFYDATSHVIPAIFESVICMGGRFKNVYLGFEDCSMYEEDWRSVQRLLQQCGSRLEYLTIDMGRLGALYNSQIPLLPNRTFQLIDHSSNELAFPSEIASIISCVGLLALKNIALDLQVYEDGSVEQILARGFDLFEKALVERFGSSKLPSTLITIRLPRESRTLEAHEDLVMPMREQMPEMLGRGKLDIRITPYD